MIDEQVKQEKNGWNWIWFALVILLLAIIGYGLYVANKIQDEMPPRTIQTTSILPTTVAANLGNLSLEDCPEQYRRKNPDGSEYCPDP